MYTSSESVERLIVVFPDCPVSGGNPPPGWRFIFLSYRPRKPANLADSIKEVKQKVGCVFGLL